jgi:hypothetical protein
VFNDNRENEGTDKENRKDMINQNNCKFNTKADCKNKNDLDIVVGSQAGFSRTDDARGWNVFIHYNSVVTLTSFRN